MQNFFWFTFLGLSTLEKFKITLEQNCLTVGQNNYGNKIPYVTLGYLSVLSILKSLFPCFKDFKNAKLKRVSIIKKSEKAKKARNSAQYRITAEKMVSITSCWKVEDDELSLRPVLYTVGL